MERIYKVSTYSRSNIGGRVIPLREGSFLWKVAERREVREEEIEKIVDDFLSHHDGEDGWEWDENGYRFINRHLDDDGNSWGFSCIEFVEAGWHYMEVAEFLYVFLKKYEDRDIRVEVEITDFIELEEYFDLEDEEYIVRFNKRGVEKFVLAIAGENEYAGFYSVSGSDPTSMNPYANLEEGWDWGEWHDEFRIITTEGELRFIVE